MRIHFTNSNYLEKSTRVIKYPLKEAIPALSTQRLKNAICQAFGYQSTTDFNQHHNNQSNKHIDYVLVHEDLTQNLDQSLRLSIGKMIVSENGFGEQEAFKITSDVLTNTAEERHSYPTVDDIRWYIRTNTYEGYLGHDAWMISVMDDADRLDQGAAQTAYDCLIEKAFQWDKQDVNDLIEIIERINILQSGRDFFGDELCDLLSKCDLPTDPLILKKWLKIKEVTEIAYYAIDSDGDLLVATDNHTDKSLGFEISIDDVDSIYESLFVEI